MDILTDTQKHKYIHCSMSCAVKKLAQMCKFVEIPSNAMKIRIISDVQSSLGSVHTLIQTVIGLQQGSPTSGQATQKM